MTDTPASLDALGIKPVGWMYSRPQAFIGIMRRFPDPHLRDDGYTETPLYSADDLAPLIAKARRVEELEAALRVAARWFEQAAITHEIAAASCPPPENESYVLAARRDTFRANELRAALKEDADATSGGSNADRDGCIAAIHEWEDDNA